MPRLAAALLLVVSIGAAQTPYQRLAEAAFFWSGLDLTISFALATVLIAMLFKYLPDAEIEWRNTWLGALITAALFIIGKQVIGLYLGQTTVASSFGAAASVVIFMLWVYYAAVILLFGAEITQAVAARRGAIVVPTENAKPARIEVRIGAAAPSADGRGSVSDAITKITARKLAALMPNAIEYPHRSPPRPMTMPASAGPTMRPRFHCADDRPTAPTTSSAGTRSGRIAWYDGNPIAFVQPAANTISVTSPGDGSPRSARAKRPNASTACTDDGMCPAACICICTRRTWRICRSFTTGSTGTASRWWRRRVRSARTSSRWS